jgi:hypothetical protein
VAGQIARSPHHATNAVYGVPTNRSVVTTTAGTKITIPASAAMITKFADELANDVQSNFVSIASTPVSPS